MAITLIERGHVAIDGARIVVWDVTGVEHACIADPVAALGLGSLPPVLLSLVQGQEVVRDGALTRGDERGIAGRVTRATSLLAGG